jgi:hypothetical protein
MTITQTATSTIIPDEEKLKVEDVVIYPNPYNPTKEDLRIKFEITQASKVVKVRIYAVSFRLIRQITQTGNYTVGENRITIDRKYLNNLANGTYYLIMTAINDRGEKADGKPEVLVVLK